MVHSFQLQHVQKQKCCMQQSTEFWVYLIQYLTLSPTASGNPSIVLDSAAHVWSTLMDCLRCHPVVRPSDNRLYLRPALSIATFSEVSLLVCSLDFSRESVRSAWSDNLNLKKWVSNCCCKGSAPTALTEDDVHCCSNCILGTWFCSCLWHSCLH